MRRLVVVALAVAALLPAAGQAREGLKIVPTRPCSTKAVVRTSAGQAIDLTGTWKAQLGTYYVRQVGSCVWWYGTSNPPGSFANVYYGSIQIDLSIRGVWADVPSGGNRGVGILNLSIHPGSPTTFMKTRETGGFFDSTWTPST